MSRHADDYGNSNPDDGGMFVEQPQNVCMQFSFPYLGLDLVMGCVMVVVTLGNTPVLLYISTPSMLRMRGILGPEGRWTR